MMNGKELKVTELELKFGGTPRLVNVFSVFRYIPNNGLYVIYADVGSTYNYICYGTAHCKDNSVLCMASSKEEDTEIIKEFIFNITSGEKLDNFEIISLENIDEIEIIGSKNFELKNEVLLSLIEKTIPKKVNPEGEDNNGNGKKKKSPLVTIVFFLLFLTLGASAYFYFVPENGGSHAVKIIYCTKQYDHDELDSVLVEEEKTFRFDNYDKLEKLDVTMRYKFNNDAVYLDFINKSLYYNYMVTDSDDTTGKYKIDDENNTFITYATTNIDESYGNPVEYEEILSVSKKDNYTCEEKIEE